MRTYLMDKEIGQEGRGGGNSVMSLKKVANTVSGYTIQNV